MSTIPDIDWHQLGEEQPHRPPSSSRKRLRWILAAYAAALLLVLCRGAQLELSGGGDFRRVAFQPIETAIPLEAERGRILARDGTVLAADHQASALAMHYRYLQSPPDPRWINRRVRERLTRTQRRDPQAVAAAEATIRGELRDLHRKLAQMCVMSDEQWRKRTTRIESRVAQLAAAVNRRRLQNFVEKTSTVPDDASLSLGSVLAGLFAPPQQLPPAEVTVAEEAAYHRIVDNLSVDVAEAIEAVPAAFPGVRVVTYIRRTYPQKMLAANLVGHVGSPSSARATIVETEPEAPLSDTTGLLGAELQFEPRLAGQPGKALRLTDRRGEVLDLQVERRPVTGRDVVLTIDVELQQFAEQLLDRFARRQDLDSSASQPQGSGAVVVMDLQSGEMLAAASQPRFDPNWFATGDARVESVLNDSGRPLFDRVTRMAIPPGSVFKPLVGIALLEHGIVRPDTSFSCRGFLDDPERLRCQIYRRHGIGHGDVTLSDALAQSCNVYFFHFARALHADPLVGWARAFGFGSAAGHGGGQLPDAEQLEASGELPMLAIGQGKLTATPLEVLGLYAAIANGGYLTTPRFTREAIVSGKALTEVADPRQPGERIAGLDAASLDTVREGLRRVVEDAAGTGFDTVRLSTVAIAGKTGTAETGGDQPDHAWFAGYAPAEKPRVAFVVVLEHGGSGSTAAGVMARHLVQRMQQLGYFPAQPAAEFPPGKG